MSERRAAWLRRASRAFALGAALLPRRIADEELGDALEEIARRLDQDRPSRAWLAAKIASALVAALWHALGEPRAGTQPGRAAARGELFGRYVAGRRPSWKRRALLFGSLGLHAAAALALACASLGSIEELTPPPLSLVFSRAPQAQSTAGPARREREPPRARKPAAHRPNTLVQPEPRPDRANDRADDRSPLADTAARDGDGGEGSDGSDAPGDDLPGGDAGEPGGRDLVPAPAQPRNVAAYQLDAEAIFHPDPHLPDFVKAQRRGTADPRFTAKVCLAQDGRVARVDVLAGIAGADDAIVGTIRAWRYRPQPIPVCFVASFVFTIQ